MQIGFLGLGRMGLNMVTRLAQGGHDVVAWNRTQSKVKDAEKAGAKGAATIEDLVNRLKGPRVVWVMVPAGPTTDDMIQTVAPMLAKGDIVVDGGNANFKDSQRRGASLAERGLQFMDAGTSGGVWGLKVGYCMMVGGEEATFKRVEPALKTLAPPNGYLHCGPVGAGHFVKMVHNGVEYGMMQAMGEGFEILNAAPYKIDLAKVAGLWNQGSVVRSWLMELMERAFKDDPKLARIRGYVDDNGEGRWTVQQAIDTGVPATVLAHSIFARFLSRQEDSFSAKVLAALRNQFGGHAVKEK